MTMNKVYSNMDDFFYRDRKKNGHFCQIILPEAFSDLISKGLLAILLIIQIIIWADTAIAQDRLLTYEELLSVNEKSTVYVVGKTSDPSPIHMNSYLTESTRWYWLFKDNKGEYHPSGLYINMTEYQAMNLSKRSLVLNHKDCKLKIQVDDTGRWHISGFKVADTPITFGSVIRAFLVGVFMIGLLFLFLGKQFITGKQNSQRMIQPSRRSKGHMTNLEAFALLSMMQENAKQVSTQPRFRIGDYVYIRYRNQYGTVIDINGELYMVRFGGGRVDSFSADQLEKG